MKALVRSTLEIAANIAVLVAAAYAGYTIWSTRSPAKIPDVGKPDYAALARSARGNAPRAAIVVMSTSCQACKGSLPFFRKLIEVAEASNGRVEVTLVFPAQAQEEVDTFIKENALHAHVTRIKLRDFGITSVPLLAIAESDGTISHVWTGLLGEREQSAVLRSVT